MNPHPNLTLTGVSKNAVPGVSGWCDGGMRKYTPMELKPVSGWVVVEIQL